MSQILQRMRGAAAAARARIQWLPGKEWLQRLFEARRRISAQLYAGIGGAVTLTLIASVVAWLSFNRVADLQALVSEGSVPNMTDAFGVAQQAGALVAAAPRLTVVATPEELERVAGELATEREAFNERLTALADLGGQADTARRVRARGRELISNLQSIEQSVSDRIGLVESTEALRRDLLDVDSSLSTILVTAIDDQYFYTMTGYRNLGEVPSPRATHFTESEVNRYRRVSELQEDAAVITQLLANALTLSDAALIEPLRERCEAAVGRIEANVASLGPAAGGREIDQLFARLVGLGTGDGSIFDLREQELRLAAKQENLLASNSEIATQLVSEVQLLVGSASDQALVAIEASDQSVRTGRSLLLVLNLVSVTGAVLIAWLFVGRVLLRRLDMLSGRMRRMARGDLESKVEIGGHDEVADMAAALEVFRRHALEVQRLNLVEKLADELKGKNEELEKVLDDLRAAQDQIVMREKLASLGELTAGVAHEIKNPLNFVKNFSEVSGELLEELREMLEAGQGKLSPEQRDEVSMICKDLTENLDCIRDHGDRANRIVHDMLMMGRASGERSPTNINSLVKEHTQLAYHSARANDPDFQLEIEETYDESIGMVEVIPQDLGRVILNIVGNACHATDGRRRDGGSDSYVPNLRIETRKNGDRVELRFRDNGGGIPQEVLEKIFNPFFTTKPAGQGTGLGLSLSNDVVREHGGEIRVDTEPGEHTEMVVDIPAVAAAWDGAEEPEGEPAPAT